MMKKQILFSILMLGMALLVKAQVNADLATVSKSERVGGIGSATVVTNDERVHFVFKIYGGIPSPKVEFEEEHFLGGELSAKWSAFNQNYTHVYAVTIGPATSNTEIVKPVVYNAVNKVNSYYKKAIRKGLVTKEEAVRKLNHIFDCANVICFDDDTEKFEQEVVKKVTPEEIITLFDCVELK